MFSASVSPAAKSRIAARIAERVSNACVRAAEVLAVEYKEGLQATVAPPHSRPGQIPHAYMGYVQGGFGPVNDDTRINNTPLQGFAYDQQMYLSEYIRSARDGFGGVVGFSPSHVQSRFKNYLIGWDQGRIEYTSVPRRPWIRPLYDQAKSRMIGAARAGLREAVAENTGVPF
jgi:hypothetical protein